MCLNRMLLSSCGVHVSMLSDLFRSMASMLASWESTRQIRSRLHENWTPVNGPWWIAGPVLEVSDRINTWTNEEMPCWRLDPPYIPLRQLWLSYFRDRQIFSDLWWSWSCFDKMQEVYVRDFTKVWHVSLVDPSAFDRQRNNMMLTWRFDWYTDERHVEIVSMWDLNALR